jgi:MFS family permease
MSYSSVSRKDQDVAGTRTHSRLAFNLGCGFARNEVELTVLRFMAGLGGGAPLAVRISPSLVTNDSSLQIGGGLISDVWKPEDRGKALSLYLLAPILGPVVGPLAGAWLAQGSNWRWIFWASTILGAVIQAAGILLLAESLSANTSTPTVYADPS